MKNFLISEGVTIHPQVAGVDDGEEGRPGEDGVSNNLRLGVKRTQILDMGCSTPRLAFS